MVRRARGLWDHLRHLTELEDSVPRKLLLSSADRDRLQLTLRVLVSPLEYENVDGWRRACMEAAKSLVRADKGVFFLPMDGVMRAFSEEFDSLRIDEYPTRLGPLDRRFGVIQRQAELGAWSRKTLNGSWLEEYYRSPYYNEYIVPIRAYDAIGLTGEVGRGAPELIIPPALMLHHDRPGGARFGEQGLALLRLLYPAFLAGVGGYLRLGGQRRDFSRTLDDLAEGLFLFDAAGERIHQNPAATELLAADPERGRLQDAVAEIARQLGRATDAEQRLAAPAHGTLRTPFAEYKLMGNYVGESVSGLRGAFLVVLARTVQKWPAVPELRRRFELTGRQAQVALLLARRKSNREIAGQLAVSPHTARRHTEHVLQKLGIRSRAAVEKRILQG